MNTSTISFNNILQFVFTGVIDYNFLCFRQAIQDVFAVKQNGHQNLPLTSSSDFSHTNGTVK